MAEPTSAIDGLAAAAVSVTATASPALVRVGRPGGRGFGIVIADGFVLTNSHNLRDRTTELTFADHRSAQGEVIAVDADGDLAVLAADTAGAAPLAWADGPAAQGAVVFAVTRTASGDDRVERRVARLLRLPHRRLGFLRGTAVGWQNRAFPGTTGVVVELGPGQPDAARYARALRRLAP